VAEEAMRRGFRVGGFVTREVRSGGVRVGFEVNTFDGRRAVLAWVGEGEPRVGKYVVKLDACPVMIGALEGAIDADLSIVDEIGAMEFKCPGFGDAVARLARSARRLLAVVHRNYVGFARGLGIEVIELTRANWSSVYAEVLRRVLG